MATPIKDTPILRGKDAVNFEKAMKEAETQKISSEEYHRIIELYNKIKPG